MKFRPAHLLRVGVPAALVAGSLVVLTSSSGSAAEPGPYRPKFISHQQIAKKAEFEPNTVMVKFKPNATKSARKAALTKFRATSEQSLTDDLVKVTGTASAPELLKKVKADPTVALASLNYKRQIDAVPNDEYYGTDQKAYLNTIRMPQAWDLAKTTGSQIVAVLDTGVDAGHPDLVGHLVAGVNTTSPNRGPIDDNGHGTMTLGIIAAGANNGAGVAGIGWNVKAMPVKVLDADGGGYDLDIAEGIDWATAHGAKVINMSLGGPGDNEVLHDAVKRAAAKGVVIVAAAGNDGSNELHYPSAYPEVISVGATDAAGALTSFSQYGDSVDVAAPGWDILSTGVRSMTPSGYEPYWYCTGTSCSVPDRRRCRGARPEQVADVHVRAGDRPDQEPGPGRRPARHRPVLRRRHPRRVRHPRRQVDDRLRHVRCRRQRPAGPRAGDHRYAGHRNESDRGRRRLVQGQRRRPHGTSASP